MILIAWVAVTVALLFALRPDLLHRPLVARMGSLRPWHLLSVLWLAALVAAVIYDFAVAVVVAIVAFVGLWLHEIYVLMHAGDDAFPGRFDKGLWLALMLVVPPVGVLLFRSYREAHWAAEKPAVGEAVRDFS